MLKKMIFILCLLPALCFAETFVAGQDYEILPEHQNTDAKTVKVTEFFSYGCPWCYRIEASLEKWQKKQSGTIAFTRIPVVFNKDWTYYAKAWYTAELLGLDQKFTPLLFKAIQTDKKILTSNQAMIDFFVAEGVDKETAESAFTQSTTVDMHVKEGNVAMGRFHISAVPAIVINEQYKTDLQMAKSEERFFKILDYLVAKARKTTV